MSKLIYKTFYYRMIYIRPEQIMKKTKDVGIPINKIKTLEYHCKFCILSKSTCMISYTLLVPIIRYFVEIYINTIKYKFLSINDYKYVVYLLDRYSNYQWIFFTKTKETIFEKFIEVITFLENQTNLKVQIIYLDNNIEFYPIELITFVIEKGIYLKSIILKASN